MAQLVFALLLELCHHVGLHSEATRAGEWSRSADFSFWKMPLVELQGKTMGIVGFGRIGREVGKIAGALGMCVIAEDAGKKIHPTGPDFRWCELDELLAAADVVSLHCPLLPQTRGIINAASLSKMKPSSFLINTSRGPLIVRRISPTRSTMGAWQARPSMCCRQSRRRSTIRFCMQRIVS